MKKGLISIFFLSFLLSPFTAFALDIEAALGLWHQEPSGSLGYKGASLNLTDELNFGSEDKLMGRVKLNLPALPGLYFVGTRTEFKGEGETSAPFTFGNILFLPGVPFDSKLQYNHYDIAVFYPIPLLKTATLSRLNLELGVNARIVDFRARISQLGVSQSEDITVVVPMLYAGVQVRPVKFLSIEAEARGLAISSQHVADFIGRVKIRPFPLVFLAGGYRYEDIEIDQSGLKADFEIKGPFVETGVEF